LSEHRDGDGAPPGAPQDPQAEGPAQASEAQPEQPPPSREELERKVSQLSAMLEESMSRARETQVTRVLLDAEVRRLEQLGQEDHLRAPRGRLAHQLLGPGDVAFDVPVAGHLDGGHCHRSGRAPEVPRVC